MGNESKPAPRRREPRTIVHLELPRALYERLDLFAKRRGYVNRPSAIRAAIEYVLSIEVAGMPLDAHPRARTGGADSERDLIRRLTGMSEAILISVLESMMLGRVNAAHVDKSQVELAQRGARKRFQDIKEGLGGGA